VRGLKGLVKLQRARNGPFHAITMDTPVSVGDHVKTGPDGFAVVTYFDGSTTSVDPNSEITMNTLDKLPGGEKSISFAQESGTSFSRVQSLVGTNSRFETTTTTSTAFVRGTEYKVRVQPGQPAVFESTTDPIVVETEINGVV